MNEKRNLMKLSPKDYTQFSCGLFVENRGKNIIRFELPEEVEVVLTPEDPKAYKNYDKMKY